MTSTSASSSHTHVHTSPHPFLHLPRTSLPAFLFAPLQPLSTSASTSASAPSRLQQAILHPPPSQSDVSTRPQAAPLSLEQVRQKAHHLAAGFADEQLARSFGLRGALQRGDTVALFSANQHDYLVVVLALQLLGCVPALCNPSYTPAELAHQLRMIRAKLVISTNTATGDKPSASSQAKKAAQLAADESDDAFEKLDSQPAILDWEEGEGSWHALAERGAEAGEQAWERVQERSKEVQAEDTAVLCFSSGTSGKPKAVCLTHQNLVSNTIQATYLLHDRMNQPLLTRWSTDGSGGTASHEARPGWYDTAHEHEAHTRKRNKRKSLGEKLKSVLHIAKKRGGEEQEKDANEEFHQDVLPQFHCYGLLVNLVALHTATPRVILPRFELHTFLSVVQQKQVTFAFVVPPILLALAKSPVVDEYDVKSLWRVASGAASLPDELVSKVHKRLGLICTDGYGMTEMSPIIAMQTLSDVEAAPGSIGVLAPNTRAVLLDVNSGQELSSDAAASSSETKAGEEAQEGELLLHGPQMMAGYLHNDEANAEAFVLRKNEKGEQERWLRTGDVVRIDHRGYVFIKDRTKDVIKAKGFQVSPAELEAILFRDDNIADCAVVGLKDSDGSEVPWAFVVRRSDVQSPSPSSAPSPTHEEPSSTTTKDDEEGEEEEKKSILDRVNGQVAGYKRIKGVQFVKEIPKSQAGKVLKKDLRALVEL